MTGYRGLSLWHDTCRDDLAPRPGLEGDLDVDVAVVGAGYTGLWTAYYLAVAEPSLRIAVLEREIARMQEARAAKEDSRTAASAFFKV